MTNNTTVIRTGYEAFGRGDIPAVLALFSKNIEWYSPDTVPFGGTFHGPDDVGGFFATLPKHYAELHVDAQQLVAQGDTVVVIGRLHGRAAAGAAFDLPFVHVWTLANGKATSFYEHFDTVKMNAALGTPAQRVDLTTKARATT